MTDQKITHFNTHLRKDYLPHDYHVQNKAIFNLTFTFVSAVNEEEFLAIMTGDT